MRFWDSQATPFLRDLKVGVGAGFRIQISYFLLRFDWAKPLSQTEDQAIKFTFGLGADF